MKGLDGRSQQDGFVYSEKARTASLGGTFRLGSRRLWLCWARGGREGRLLGGVERRWGCGRG